MSIYSLHSTESVNAAHLTASIERCAIKGAEENGMSHEDFIAQMRSAVDFMIAGQDDPVEAWNKCAFNTSEALDYIGLEKKRWFAVGPLVRLLNIKILEMERLGE